MKLDVIVKTKKSGGTLSLMDLNRYSRERDYNVIPCDFEQVNLQQLFGVEIISTSDCNLVLYSYNNDKNTIQNFLNEVNYQNSENLKNAKNYLKQKYIGYNFAIFDKISNIGEIYSYLIEVGICSSINQAISEIDFYGLPLDKLIALAESNNVKFYLKCKNKYISLTDYKLSAQFMGFIVCDLDIDESIKSFCKTNDKLLLIGSDFASHSKDRLLSAEDNLNEDYILKCYNKFLSELNV